MMECKEGINIFVDEYSNIFVMDIEVSGNRTVLKQSRTATVLNMDEDLYKSVGGAY